jgi:class 3 adenylate cyclase/tetratricopeptide (TPR) repeat protein
MSRCPACGHENQPGAKFCSECATPIVVTVLDPREERKVVTVLFADLVGFTSRSERLDPEDVRALLSPYYARLRAELERYGGTVEKFIGDAVMALFGAPLAHEDDPERAVRAALAIRDWVVEDEAELQLRIAVNTGEALVALDAKPGHGEGMASGDVVNTTSRLQTAAPINGILVGEATYRATDSVIAYRAVDAVAAKGKTEPIAAWEALEARSRVGVDLAAASRVPLVGRDAELRVLTEALARVRRDRAPQLVTLVGVPGIGKSRLVAELLRTVHEDPTELIYWRQGNSLPYGDGVTFWALGEIVKSHAGILETDTPGDAEAKLDAAVAAAIPNPSDAQWISGHLRPLAGLGEGVEAASDGRDEAFTAWRRFFEALAEESPLVLVFEDLHWADDNLLDFVEYLVDWASTVPLLVVCDTRPELFERRGGWAGAIRNAIRLSLTPLSDAETATLISLLSERPVMAAETQEVLVARAGGNPLYAEQYVRMLSERSSLRDLPLPETVQGIIAARLDSLPVEEKRLLQDASVMGSVFWLGAVVHDGEPDRRTVEMRLHALERKDFIRRARRSSFADEAEYAFLHVLVREVAYGQIPRGQRAQRHRRAAEWISALGRTEDHAEMVAHHYVSALELQRASGQTIDDAFAGRAITSLRDAGERAYSLNAFASAAGFFETALGLALEGTEEHARLLFNLARARYAGGTSDPALMRTASEKLAGCGDRETAAEAEVILAEMRWYRGDTDGAFEHVDRARTLVTGAAGTPILARVESSASRYLVLSGDYDEAIRLGRDALALAEQSGLDDVRAEVLINIGLARCDSGDERGTEDLEEAVAIATRLPAPRVLCRALSNQSSIEWQRGSLERASATMTAARETSARYGQVLELRWIRGELAMDEYVLGRWDNARAAADDFLSEVEAGAPHYSSPRSYAARALIKVGRDDVAGARSDAERSLETASLAKDPQTRFWLLAACASIFQECGDNDRAAELSDQLLSQLRAGTAGGAGTDALHLLASAMSALGRGRELVGALPDVASPWGKVAAAVARGDERAAIDIYETIGARSAASRARLRLAANLIREHRRTEADLELQLALSFYREVRATRFIGEVEALFAATG